jgi:hypothetical protein
LLGVHDVAEKHSIQHIPVEPSRPIMNAYIESFNDTFCDACFDKNWLESLEQAP